MGDPKLCYVKGGFAYFTTLTDVKDQWGDDWDNAPYEHNAGEPYHSDDQQPERYEIVKVAFDGPFDQPCTLHLNSPFSVEQINAGAVAWLRSPSYDKDPVAIPAGATLDEFIRLVMSAGGTVYLPIVADEGTDT